MPNFVVMKDRKQLYNMQVKSKQGKDGSRFASSLGTRSHQRVTRYASISTGEKKPLFGSGSRSSWVLREHVFLEKSRLIMLVMTPTARASTRIHRQMLWEEMEDGADEDEDEM